MNLRRIRRYLTALPLLDAAQLLLAHGVRRLLDRPNCDSYAQFGEDRIIPCLFDQPEGYRGFYVDVGCNHPVRGSNTYKLYLLGWQGIAVDASGRFRTLWRRKRPLDTFVHATLDEQPGPVTFYELADSAKSSTVRPPLAQPGVLSVEARTSQRLTDVLASCHCPPFFDLLSIDVEGVDLRVLKSLDLSRYRATLIVIECRDFLVREPTNDPITQHLEPFGYRYVGYAILNAYFLTA